jgi:hypothetical protein
VISIVIPAYDMHGFGLQMLTELVDSIRAQRFTDYEIIVSDASATQEIFNYCFMNDLRWIAGREGAPANLNHAIDYSIGSIIKPMFQDDKLIDKDTLISIWSAFKDQKLQWLACNSQNGGDEGMRDDLFRPYPHSSVFRLSEGENTYGSPSAVAWRRNDLRFDEQLPWLFDCEFYGRMAESYGVPMLLDVPVFIRNWSGMATATVATGQQRVLDHNRVVEKFRAAGMDV